MLAVLLPLIPSVGPVNSKGPPIPFKSFFSDARLDPGVVPPFRHAKGDAPVLGPSSTQRDGVVPAPLTRGRQLFHSATNRITRMSAGGGDYDSEITWQLCFDAPSHSTCWSADEGAFTYTSQGAKDPHGAAYPHIPRSHGAYTGPHYHQPV